jgi:hypothetical protein
MYEVVDVHGGRSGVPVWMTERCWVNFEVLSSPRVSLKALRAVTSLLESVRKASDESDELSFEGVGDEKSKAKSLTVKMGDTSKAHQAGR